MTCNKAFAGTCRTGLVLLNLFGGTAVAGASGKANTAPVAMRGESMAHSGVETEHLYGFTEGADLAKRGTFEFEFDAVGRFSKSHGSYAAVTKTIEFKYSPSDNLLVSAALEGAYLAASSVPDFASIHGFQAQGASVEVKYRLLDRHVAPFGLTLAASPNMARSDETSGERVRAYGAEFLLAIDRELVQRVYGAFNLIFELGVSRAKASGERERESALGLSAALSGEISPGIFVGAELRYMRAYDGLGLDDFAGEAWFAGPTAYVKLSDRVNMTAAWSIQFSGRPAGGPRGLDLLNFERHQARLRFGFEF